MSIHDDRICELGEGPLWHPLLGKLFWFDILGRKMLCDDGSEWLFREHVSAAGWIDRDHLLIASESRLFRFNLITATSDLIAPLEQNNDVTRSNDGRADPWGGFWIGTMGKNAEANAGAIYRMYDGKVVKLFGDITITNSICFSPDRKYAYATDTPSKIILRIPLDDTGFPQGDIDQFIDLNGDGMKPDGSVIAADGTLFNAQWGASRVARYDTDGCFMEDYPVSASQATCPAFNGSILYVTSAAKGLDEPDGGKTFAIETNVTGQQEHQIKL